MAFFQYGTRAAGTYMQAQFAHSRTLFMLPGLSLSRPAGCCQQPVPAWIAFDALAFGSRRDRFAHPQKGGRPGLLLLLLPAVAAASCRYSLPLPATCWAARGRGSALAELPGRLAAWLPGLRGLGRPTAWLPPLRPSKRQAGLQGLAAGAPRHRARGRRARQGLADCLAPEPVSSAAASPRAPERASGCRH